MRRLLAYLLQHFHREPHSGARKTAVETVASSLPARATATVLGATAGGAAVLLAPLLQTLAAKRQAARLETHFSAMQSDITALGKRIDDLSDEQLKVVAEIADASRLTFDVRKLELMRRAAKAVLNNPDVVSGDADALARLVRDLSLSELLFIIDTFKFSSVRIDTQPSREVASNELLISPGDPRESLVSGLIGHGLLYTKGSSWDSQMYEWSPLAAKLLAIINRDEGAAGAKSSSVEP
jgi:hypothetical protein